MKSPHRVIRYGGGCLPGGWQEAEVCLRCRAKDPCATSTAEAGSGKRVI
jgi:hypothetical protein